MSRNIFSRFFDWITFSTSEYSEISRLERELTQLREEFRKFTRLSGESEIVGNDSSENSNNTLENIKPNYDDYDYDDTLKTLRLIIRKFIHRYHDERIQWVKVKYPIMEKKYFVYIRLTPIPCFSRSSTEVHHQTFYITMTIERGDAPTKAFELTFDHNARNGIDGGVFTYGKYLESKYTFSFNSNEFYKYVYKVLYDKSDLNQILYDLNKFII